MTIGVIIPAAGQGKRMNSDINKQYLLLNDQPILAHTINVFVGNPLYNQITVVVREDELDYCQREVIDKYFDQSIKLIAGGKTRRESVFAGLKSFSPAIDYVIIHDGARPLLSRDILNSVIDAVKRYKAVTVGYPLKDTIKRINKDNLVIETPVRNDYLAIQTPQAFVYDLIMKAHQSIPSGKKVTDDSSLMELMGHQVKVIRGSDQNIKITTPLDLKLAELILDAGDYL